MDTPEEFMEYFRANYPGPDTIIHKPDYHAPKIYRAAIAAYKREEASKQLSDVRPLSKEEAELYPQHDKLRGVTQLSQPLGGFIEWLESMDYTICENVGRKFVTYEAVRKTVNEWLASYFEIDLVELDKEKVAMIDVLRKANSK